MYYTIDYEALWALIDREVSRVADKSYSEGGVSMYDALHLTSNDKPAVRALVDDAISKLVSREHDICRYAPLLTTEEDVEIITPRLLFFVPDMSQTNEEPAKQEIDRYICFYVTASHLGALLPNRAQEYVTLSQAAMDKAVTILKTRQSPTESW